MEGGQSQQQSNDWKIGSSVALETALGERVEGVVYAFDRVMNCVILQDAPMNPTQKKTYRIINANFIKKKGPGPALPASTMDVRPVRPLDMGRIRAKEASAVADARKDAARINTNVSTDAQKIFNALAKTFAPPPQPQPIRYTRSQFLCSGLSRIFLFLIFVLMWMVPSPGCRADGRTKRSLFSTICGFRAPTGWRTCVAAP
jgi:small nuclear ribonucleoprotein (snRNP)-like protein